ncbi:MAG: DUF4097 family beta strand repeat-containing protein [Negativicutes bacterium]|nr:DUF4097 family beta strand repeat-containing protein [Negativicutes bacterium]
MSMIEERKMILQMVEEGKIKADEAVLLLEALAESAPEPSAAESDAAESGDANYDFKNAMHHMKYEMKEAAREAKRAAKETALEARWQAREMERLAREQAGRQNSEAARRAREEDRQFRKSRDSGAGVDSALRDSMGGVGGLVNSVLSNVESAFGFNVFDSTYTFEEQIEGNFLDTDAKRAVFIHIQTANGRIECLGWNRNEFRLILSKKIRAGSEEEARSKAESRVTVSHTDEGLIIDGKSLNGINSGMSVELWLPQNRVYDFTLNTGNGRIVLEDLTAEGIEGRTSNGRIALHGVTAKVALLCSSNGSVLCDGGIPLLTAYTSNGSVNIAATEQTVNTFELSTTNGTVRVRVADCTDLAHDFDLSTSFGKVKVDLPGAVGGYAALAKYRHVDTTPDFIGYQKRLRLAASTSNGSISVSPAEEI